LEPRFETRNTPLERPRHMSRILLAEDDDSLRNFLARALERAGYEVRACPDGEAAITALDDGPYDLLLTDIVIWRPRIRRRKALRCSPSQCICARSWPRWSG